MKVRNFKHKNQYVIEDGRKRAIFALTNFLVSVGWDYDMIEKKLKEWNERNPEPLREVYINGQIRYHKHSFGPYAIRYTAFFVSRRDRIFERILCHLLNGIRGVILFLMF